MSDEGLLPDTDYLPYDSGTDIEEKSDEKVDEDGTRWHIYLARIIIFTTYRKISTVARESIATWAPSTTVIRSQDLWAQHSSWAHAYRKSYNASLNRITGKLVETLVTVVPQQWSLISAEEIPDAP